VYVYCIRIVYVWLHRYGANNSVDISPALLYMYYKIANVLSAESLSKTYSVGQ
jgi:hypothetical protein